MAMQCLRCATADVDSAFQLWGVHWGTYGRDWRHFDKLLRVVTASGASRLGCLDSAWG